MKGEIDLIQLVLSVILYFVIFFGISFILNMLLRRTWLMAILYPFIIVIVIHDIKVFEYVKHPITNFGDAFTLFFTSGYQNIIILSAGFVGTLVSGIVIRFLRRSGYQMF